MCCCCSCCCCCFVRIATRVSSAYTRGEREEREEVFAVFVKFCVSSKVSQEAKSEEGQDRGPASLSLEEQKPKKKRASQAS